MTPEDLYPFSAGRRLEERNTYFYVPFRGSEFLHAWTRTRALALAELAPPEAWFGGETGAGVLAPPFHTEQALLGLLERLHGRPVDPAAMQLLRGFLQRFEVTKRIYTDYNDRFRAADGAVYDQLSLYIIFGHALNAGYVATGGLNFLNGLLKVNDTLVALRDDLIRRESAALSWLLQRECEHVRAVAAQHGVKI